MDGSEPPKHYMGPNMWNDEEGFRDRLDKDYDGALAEYAALRGKKGDDLHREQKITLKKSFMDHYQSEHLDDVVGAVQEHYGSSYDDSLSGTVHHLDKEPGMAVSRKVARGVALHLAEVFGGPELKEKYKTADPDVLDKFVEGELSLYGQQLGVQISNVEDLAKLIYKEQFSIEGALSGTLDENEHRNSFLSQVMDSYRKGRTGVARSRPVYDRVFDEHLEDDGNWEKFHPIANASLAQSTNSSGERLQLAPTANRRLARQYFAESQKPGFATPEHHSALPGDGVGQKLVKDDMLDET